MISYNENDWIFKVTDNNGQFHTDPGLFWDITVILTQVIGHLGYSTAILPIV